MVSLKAYVHILEELDRIEKSQDIRILYASEAGSRAWGIDSRDSDYDVRFIYIHKRDWYLSIEERRDVIERPVHAGLDVNGWELRKALRLLQKSNPSLLEWLKSPVVYAQNEKFVREFRELASHYYSPHRTFQHYLHLAFGHNRDYLRGEQVRLKKYFYALRAILACRWIEQDLGEVPIAFDDLISAVLQEEEVRWAVEVLLEKKRAGEELNRSPRIEILNDFIETELSRLGKLDLIDPVRPDASALDHFFRQFAMQGLEPILQ